MNIIRATEGIKSIHHNFEIKSFEDYVAEFISERQKRWEQLGATEAIADFPRHAGEAV